MNESPPSHISSCFHFFFSCFANVTTIVTICPSDDADELFFGATRFVSSICDAVAFCMLHISCQSVRHARTSCGCAWMRARLASRHRGHKQSDVNILWLLLMLSGSSLAWLFAFLSGPGLLAIVGCAIQDVFASQSFLKLASRSAMQPSHPVKQERADVDMQELKRHPKRADVVLSVVRFPKAAEQCGASSEAVSKARFLGFCNLPWHLLWRASS